MTNIEEGNKIIGEFMGLEFVINDKVNYPKGNHDYTVKLDGKFLCQYYGHKEDLFNKNCPIKYHTSWDWLMPVVEKITEMGYSFLLEKNFTLVYKWRCKIYGTSRDCHFISERTDKITDAVYPTIIQFIQWLNNQNK